MAKERVHCICGVQYYADTSLDTYEKFPRCPSCEQASKKFDAKKYGVSQQDINLLFGRIHHHVEGYVARKIHQAIKT